MVCPRGRHTDLVPRGSLVRAVRKDPAERAKAILRQAAGHASKDAISAFKFSGGKKHTPHGRGGDPAERLPGLACRCSRGWCDRLASVQIGPGDCRRPMKSTPPHGRSRKAPTGEHPRLRRLQAASTLHSLAGDRPDDQNHRCLLPKSAARERGGNPPGARRSLKRWHRHLVDPAQPGPLLEDAGVSGSDAHAYAEGVRRGGSLVIVRCDAAKVDQAVSILDIEGVLDFDEQKASRHTRIALGTRLGLSRPPLP